MVIQDFLAWLTREGLIVGFAAIDPADDEMLKAADYLALGPLNGLTLTAAQVGAQFSTGTWDEVGGRAVGGHCVPTGGYSASAQDEEDCATWATRVRMTARFLDARRDEAWAVILPVHLTHPAFRAHFDMAAFGAAYEEITGRPFPADPTPPPAPTPPPGGGACFPVAADVAEAVHHAATARGLSDAAEVDRVLRSAFHLR